VVLNNLDIAMNYRVACKYRYTPAVKKIDTDSNGVWYTLKLKNIPINCTHTNTFQNMGDIHI
jgi:hypothetical protein